MNARIISLILFVCLILSACAPAAAPTPIAVEPRSEPPVQERPSQELPQEAPPQVAPAAGEAPGYEWPAPAPTAMPGTTFEDYGVNPEERARRDHLSTFSVDVDTAAYAVARRYIQEGSLPPFESVRVEEFVNAFDQGYITPEASAFAIYADAAPNPFVNDDTWFLRVGLQGYRVSRRQREPLYLTFVIDISGSMKMENRLELVKDSLELLVDQLGPDDLVTVVVYGSDARLLLEPTPGDERNRILRAINRLRTEGSTNAEAGLRMGYEYAMSNYQPWATNRVILCSDGVANTGETDVDNLLEMVGGYVAEGIDLTTAGFGLGNYNDVLLEQLADRGNGNYAYVDDIDEARKVFVEDLTATMQVIAYDAKVQVDFNPDLVAEYRLAGYENREIADQDFRDDSVDAGEIGAGHTATAVYQIRLRPGAEGRIATVQVRWQDAETREVRELNGNFNSWDVYPSFDESDPYYQRTVLVAAFAEVLRASPYAQASLGEIARMANQVTRLLPEDEQAWEFTQLVRDAAWLAGE